MPTHAALPDDIDALKAMIRERDAAILARDEVVQSLRGELSTCKVEIEQLKLFIAKLKRMQFGRKSEKLDRQIEQLELKLEDLQADEEESAIEMQQRGRIVRARPERKPLPPHLPREEKVYTPEATQMNDDAASMENDEIAQWLANRPTLAQD